MGLSDYRTFLRKVEKNAQKSEDITLMSGFCKS